VCDTREQKGLAHPLHAHIERGQKWVEEKKAKKEMEIQRERLEHAKKAAGSAFALIGQRERRSVREGSLRGLVGGSPTNYPEAMTSSGSEIRSRLASDSSGRLALNLNLASNGSSSSSSHARPRGVDLVKECEGYVIEGGQCRSELLSPRVLAAHTHTHHRTRTTAHAPPHTHTPTDCVRTHDTTHTLVSADEAEAIGGEQTEQAVVQGIFPQPEPHQLGGGRPQAGPRHRFDPRGEGHQQQQVLQRPRRVPHQICTCPPRVLCAVVCVRVRWCVCVCAVCVRGV
jgi:hypothetical protein